MCCQRSSVRMHCTNFAGVLFTLAAHCADVIAPALPDASTEVADGQQHDRKGNEPQPQAPVLHASLHDHG